MLVFRLFKTDPDDLREVFMSDYILSCCSTADLSKEHFDKRNISYICFHYTLDGVEYPDDLGVSMPVAALNERLKLGYASPASQVNTTEYVEYFEKVLKEGKDILHVCLSSGISGT